MSTKPLVIVESPSKAGTIEKYLGGEYEVLASVGHIKDLPDKELAVDIERDFHSTWIVPPRKKAVVQRLKEAAQKADAIYLATDPDREGEAIAAHVAAELPDKPHYRVRFHEITRKAVQEALAHPEEIDEHLVNAQLARRVLDRLVGYLISPQLWRTLRSWLKLDQDSGLSAGRVQSATLRLLVDRERERLRFRTARFFDLEATLQAGASDSFTATLIQVGGKRVATGKDFDAQTGRPKSSQVVVLNETDAQALQARLLPLPWTLDRKEVQPKSVRPRPPYTTSTLQQDAARRFGSSARVMRLAQQLYEAGFISYMRTDSTQLSSEAIQGARTLIAARFGEQYLPSRPIQYANKVKNAQEAHEAIRPAGTQFADPQVVARELGKPAAQLYEMIWKRTLASQMKPAQKEQTVLEIVVDDTRFKATGEVLLFDGFYRVMGVPKELTQNQLPPLEEGAALACTECRVVDHQTKPPARYTEATLVKEMEKIGIGRPSTYARTIEHLLDRKYAEKQSGNLVPTYVGVALVRVLENHFEPIVDYQFTADMEAVLDEIARGREQYLSFLKSFYYGSGERPGLEQLLENRIESRRACTLPLEGDQADVELIIGSKGPYLKQGDRTRSVPAGVYLGDLKPEKVQAILEDDSANIPLGHHPRTGEPIYFRVGRYGPYLALGESRNKSVPQSISRDQIDLDWAVQWLALPRKVGVHPETGEEIQADWGKYGPYAKVGSENVALPRGTSPLDVTLEDILTAYRARQARNRKPVVLRQLGTDPETGLELVLKEGRYGPYVTDGKVNASLPRGENPETISREDCLKLIQAKRSAPPKKRRKGKRK